MTRFVLQMLLVAAISVGLWQITTFLAGVTEPWDSTLFFPAYGVALILAWSAGKFFHKPLMWGFVISFAQQPVMSWNCVGMCPGPLWPVGLMFMLILAVPLVIVAAIGSRASHRGRS
jgi:hypothetical protein